MQAGICWSTYPTDRGCGATSLGALVGDWGILITHSSQDDDFRHTVYVAGYLMITHIPIRASAVI